MIIITVLVAQSCPTLCNLMDCSLPGSSVHGISPGKNTGVGYHSLLPGTFLTQGSNRRLLHLLTDRQILSYLSDQGGDPQPWFHEELVPRDSSSSHLSPLALPRQARGKPHSSLHSTDSRAAGSVLGAVHVDSSCAQHPEPSGDVCRSDSSPNG